MVMLLAMWRACTSLLLLCGCVWVVDPDAGPTFVSADATCAGETWTLEAHVSHGDGADEVAVVFVDVALAFPASGGTWDLESLGTIDLDSGGGDLWARSVSDSLGLLDCGYQGAYGLTFTAEDQDGDREQVLRIIEQDRAPTIVTADAWCDDGNDFWILQAEVDHPAGLGAIGAVWVEVHHVWEDASGEDWVFVGTVGLDWDPEFQDWYREVDNDPNLLDCLYPDLYGFSFIAEDTDGDQDAVEFVH